MSRSVIKGMVVLAEGLASQEGPINENTLKADVAGGWFSFQDFDLNATPTGLGTADEGKVWKIGSSPTGLWATEALGGADKLGIWSGSGWTYMDPAGATVKGAIAGVVASGASNFARETMCYHPVADDWYPLGGRLADPSSNVAAEYWTGRYVNGRKRWAKTIDFGALPNTTFKNVAHSISSLELGDAWYPHIFATASDGTTVYVLPLITTTGVVGSFTINATNVNIITNTNLSSYSTHVIIEYCKTS